MSETRPFDELMREVCVTYGYCGGIVDGKPSHVTDFIPESGPVTAKQFADWLFLADGADPTEISGRQAKLHAALESAFVRHLGAATVDASILRWV